jgi:hypothetical protein
MKCGSLEQGSLLSQLLNTKEMKEGENVEDFDHVLEMDDIWTWISISGQGRPRMQQYHRVGRLYK